MNNSLNIKYFAVEGWKKRDLDEADGWWEVLFQSSFSSFSLTKQHHNKGIVVYKAFIDKQQSLQYFGTFHEWGVCCLSQNVPF